MLTQEDLTAEGMHTIKDLQFYCMTPYDASFKGVHILFPKENVTNTLGEYLSAQGKKQLHTAHSQNPVPFIYVTNNNSVTVKNGRLADVAPSALHIMGLEKLADMTGENLICD